MTSRKRDTSLGVGVYYHPNDYPGLMRRLMIAAIDLTVLLVAFYLLAIVSFAAVGDLNIIAVLIYALAVWLYLTAIKASKMRTVGYLLTGSRILNLRGARPSILRMTFRMLLSSMSLFSTVPDMLWCGIDDDNQSLHDRFSGTCVVRTRAEPIGTAEIHLMYYTALGCFLKYPRVMRPKVL